MHQLGDQLASGGHTVTQGQCLISGFPSVACDMHQLGGQLASGNNTVTQEQCLMGCMVINTCLGADYNELEMSCYWHLGDTVCSPLVPKDACKNFRKVACNGDTPIMTERNPGFHVLGGTVFCRECTEDVCLAECVRNNSCLGADYNRADMSCFFHYNDTVCDMLVMKQDCINFRVSSCSGDGNTVDTGPTTAQPPGGVAPGRVAAPQGNFMVMNFPGPETLPSTALAYPASNTKNGRLRGFGLTGQECVDQCFAEVTCLATDFNSVDGSCWIHTRMTSCDPLMQANQLYHIKKTACPAPFPMPTF
ncbi:unnamed protein product [Owenia fusiformis]|uniref:Uncharacterized protein n=1 Tax=Owenia fusiformis TaxID=6347 RepID=A0A8J1YBE1_OWEFU|nr:unnamed protein product [Owenia fusiformis]